MPPKGWRKYADGFKPVNSSGTPVKEKPKFSLDDLLLPKATIHKLASEALPAGTPIPSEGVLALRRSTAVFISYLSLSANTIAHASGRKTIQAGDVLAALESIDLAQFLPRVRERLEEYESYVAEKKAHKKQDELKDDGHLISDDEDKPEEEVQASEVEEPAKRQRLEADDAENGEPSVSVSADASKAESHNPTDSST